MICFLLNHSQHPPLPSFHHRATATTVSTAIHVRLSHTVHTTATTAAAATPSPPSCSLCVTAPASAATAAATRGRGSDTATTAATPPSCCCRCRRLYVHGTIGHRTVRHQSVLLRTSTVNHAAAASGGGNGRGCSTPKQQQQQQQRWRLVAVAHLIIRACRQPTHVNGNWSQRSKRQHEQQFGQQRYTDRLMTYVVDTHRRAT